MGEDRGESDERAAWAELADRAAWADRADRAQDALTAAFGTRLVRGGLRTTAPWRLRHAFAFNYWWLAHAVEVRIDAFERSGDPARLESAARLVELLRRRNRGTLVNDYFDDMGWLSVALLRLHGATGSRRWLDDAVGLWEHIRSTGWNSAHGASVAWRTQQLDYKNAPTNGVFALLSARLFAATGAVAYASAARSALSWIDETLVDPTTGVVTDGVNRLGDGRRDDDWVFSYNQGLYVGALVEVAGWGAGADEPVGQGARAAPVVPDSLGTPVVPDALARAERTALAAAARLAPTGVITTENARFDRRGGGDIGLFKGVFVRYAGEVIGRLPADSPGRRVLVDFVRTTTDALWSSIRNSPGLRAGDDWSLPAGPVTFLSTQLSGVMALETRARLERNEIT